MAPAPRRRSFLPRWLIVALTMVAVGGVAVAVVLVADRPETVVVPDVEGLEKPVARSRLAQTGLLLHEGDVRYSGDVPAGSVLEQSPKAGESVPAGSVVTVVVSAGADTFEMPDYVGESVLVARAELEARGVIVEVEPTLSDAPHDTVVATFPAPGAQVRTGSTVRLTISADVSGDVLLPAELTGMRILLDVPPRTDSTATPDIAYDVARTLRSLLEASGAMVVMTRSAIETNSPEALRVSLAAESSATVAVGIERGEDGDRTHRIASLTPAPDRADSYLASIQLARTTADTFNAAGHDAALAPGAPDPVLEAAACPAIRVFLADPTNPLNTEAVADPAWSDTVARVLYQAIASTAR